MQSSLPNFHCPHSMALLNWGENISYSYLTTQVESVSGSLTRSNILIPLVHCCQGSFCSLLRLLMPRNFWPCCVNRNESPDELKRNKEYKLVQMIPADKKCSSYSAVSFRGEWHVDRDEGVTAFVHLLSQQPYCSTAWTVWNWWSSTHFDLKISQLYMVQRYLKLKYM